MYINIHILNRVLNVTTHPEPVLAGVDATVYVWHLYTYEYTVSGRETRYKLLHSSIVTGSVFVWIIRLFLGRYNRKCVGDCGIKGTQSLQT